MKALVLEKDKVLRYREFPLPEKRYKNSYLIKVIAAGICGSDLHRAFGGGAYHYPLIMGHEFSGEIKEAFKGAKFNEGDRVTAFPLIPCKECTSCQTGEYAQCNSYDYLGSRSNGAYAQYIYVPEENLFLVPEHIDMLHAALTEPAAVALHGVKKLNIFPGSMGVVYGGGFIGNIIAQWMRIRGARDVIVVDVDDKKLKISEDMGFIPFDSRGEDPVDAILSYTNKSGADYAVEACGLPITFLQSIKSVRNFGEVVFMGNIAGTFKIGEKDFSNILRKEIKIYGTWNSKIIPRGKDDWSIVLKYMDRELQVAPLISHLPRLNEGKEVFDRLDNKEEFFNRVVFTI